MTDKKNNNDSIFDFDGPAAWDEDPVESGLAKVRFPKKESKKSGFHKTPRPKNKKSRGRKIIMGLVWFALGLGLFCLVTIFGIYAYYSDDLPSISSLHDYKPKAVTYLYSDDGRVVGEYYHERRFVRPLEEIPPIVKEAFIAVEDASFYSHMGINFKAILRAAWRNFHSGEARQGASTITQQVVRSFLLTPEKTLTRKIREAILAFRIEGNFTKDEILFLYLNQIYLGRGAYGVEAASRTYFDKSVEYLTVAEAALLAGITQSPEGKNPVGNPAKARERQLYGIARMLDVGFITKEEAEAARAEAVVIKGDWANPNTTVAPYFVEHVRRMLEDMYGKERLYNDGLKVYTTVNIEAQMAADAAVNRGLWEYSRRRGWKGVTQSLKLDENIAEFLEKQEEKLPPEGLAENHLYQAVVMEIDAKNSALSVRVGPYVGHIGKKNLAWALGKGGVAKAFKRGDLIWVRLAEISAAPKKNKKEETAEPVDLAALVAHTEVSAQEMVLEQQNDLQTALLSMDLSDGSVKAMVGGRDFNESQFNRAIQSRRQPGSSFKPIVYASAMDNGFTPGSIMLDAPLVVDDVGSNRRWKPVNSDLKFKGPMTLYSALVSSRNLITVKILDRIGFKALKTTALNLGITDPLPESLTVALGAQGLPMPQLLGAYSAFPNMGRRVVPRYINRIEDRNGNVLAQFEPEFVAALDPGTACALTYMLRGVVAQGTGSAVKPLGRPVGGKTGTTNDYSDAWFIGFTPELVTAVWVGTDTPKPRAVGEVGGKVAAPMFLYYMKEALKDKPMRDFLDPPEGTAVIQPGGAFGICYKAGTVGTGISEIVAAENPEEDFLMDDFASGLGVGNTGPVTGPSYNQIPIEDGDTIVLDQAGQSD